ncbi:hypothetical protein CHS0354_000175 [Potamilus streckersoni]|uniref:Uncharacterized protein n=1 Tax=Potamilus streckersoni TaxID=2493646 RepID=A0AAE0RM66_9BIVA|nr:hypothetical protein CHS0354_000175 [Potamilus streckersoni]
MAPKHCVKNESIESVSKCCTKVGFSCPAREQEGALEPTEKWVDGCMGVILKMVLSVSQKWMDVIGAKSFTFKTVWNSWVLIEKI